MEDRASWFRARASSKDPALTKSTLCRKNIRPGAFEPVHDLLEGFQGGALLSIFETEQARRRDSEFSCVGSIRDFTPSFYGGRSLTAGPTSAAWEDGEQNIIPFAEYLACAVP